MGMHIQVYTVNYWFLGRHVASKIKDFKCSNILHMQHFQLLRSFLLYACVKILINRITETTLNIMLLIKKNFWLVLKLKILAYTKAKLKPKQNF